MAHRLNRIFAALDDTPKAAPAPNPPAPPAAPKRAKPVRRPKRR